MPEIEYDAASTALLLVDPYNDFLSDGGKIWPMVRGVAADVGLLENLRTVVAGVRAVGIRVSSSRIGVGNPETTNPGNTRIRVRIPCSACNRSRRGFGAGIGIPNSSHGRKTSSCTSTGPRAASRTRITHVVAVGLLANTCIESTGRFPMELGYHVTLVSDATAAFSRDHMHAAHGLNGPPFAHAILATAQFLDALPLAPY
jgi:nicotinamidase-related amidase